MFDQRQIIQRARDLARSDERVEALLLYGSFAAGEGDEHSDVDLYVYVDDAALPHFHEAEWLGAVAPVLLCYRNEYGFTSVVFDGLVRGEFHFVAASSIPELGHQSPRSWLPPADDCVLHDRAGRLRTVLEAPVQDAPDRSSPESVRFLASSVANWLLMVDGLRRRGEYARAVDFLSQQVHPHLLRLARVAGGSTANWIRPTRRLERDLSPVAYQRYRDTVAAPDPESLTRAVGEAWGWCVELVDAVGDDRAIDSRLRDQLDERFGSPDQPDAP